MKTILKKFFAKYFNSWWMPITFFLVTLFVFNYYSSLYIQLFEFFRAILISTLFGVFSAAVWNFFKRRWIKGSVNLLFFVGVVAFFWISFMIVSSFFGTTSDDGFADNLAIPTDIEIVEPLDEIMAEPNGKKDPFQQALLSALKLPGNNDPTITANITNLTTLQKDSPDILKRYFATNPSWRLFEENGSIFATRRWKIDGEWLSSLNGYYTKHDVSYWADDSLPFFQFRFTIGLSNEPWIKNTRDATYLTPGDTSPLKLSMGNDVYESLCVISGEDFVVEVFEQSDAKERRLTKAALSFNDAELESLVAYPSWEVIHAALIASDMRQGNMFLELRNSFQPGIYDAIMWVNPGEPGRIYLKAFEVTHEIPLSADSLKERTNEWVGWSEDPSELFFSNAHFTIYEGDWGKPYAARFEIWFVPDSGAPEQKLMEKVFKIEGWQR